MTEKLRFLTISSPDFPIMYCNPADVTECIYAIVGDDPGHYSSEDEPMEPITITIGEAWMTQAEFDDLPETQAEFDDLPDWSP